MWLARRNFLVQALFFRSVFPPASRVLWKDELRKLKYRRRYMMVNTRSMNICDMRTRYNWVKFTIFAEILSTCCKNGTIISSVIGGAVVSDNWGKDKMETEILESFIQNQECFNSPLEMTIPASNESSELFSATHGYIVLTFLQLMMRLKSVLPQTHRFLTSQSA